MFQKNRWAKNVELLSQKTVDELRDLISGDLPSDSTAETSEEVIAPRKYEKSLQFKVAGVTFKSGRRSRQVMLKNMYFRNTPPFDEKIEITFKRYDYEGKLAIGVYANDLQIGNVPANLIDTFNSYWTSDYIAKFSVYGGGSKSWGCEVDVVFE